jgi:hypothetical protein
MSAAKVLSVPEEVSAKGGDVVSIRPPSIPSTGGLDKSSCGSSFKPVDIAELYDEVDGDIPWALEGYLVVGGLTLLAGPPKLGKTTFAYHALVSIAANKSFLGREVTQGTVLLLAVEEHRRDIIQRLLDCSDKNLSGLVRVEFGPLPFGESVLEKMVHYIQQEGIGLVVIDTLPAWWRLTDESDASEVIRKGMPLIEAIRETKAAWLGLVHSRKGGGTNGEEIRGSSALLGLVDIAISMKRTEGGRCQRKLETVSRYADTPSELVIELNGDEYKVLGTPDEISASAKAEKLWAALTDSDQTTEELMKKTGLSKQDISRATGKLGNKTIRSGKGHRGDPYCYRRNSIHPTSKSIPEVLDELSKPPEPLAE